MQIKRPHILTQGLQVRSIQPYYQFFRFQLSVAHLGPLPPLSSNIEGQTLLTPAATPRVGSKFTKSQIYSTKLTLHPHIRFYSNFNPSLLLTYYLTYLRSRTFQTYLGPKNWTLEVQNFPKFIFFHFFDWGQISYDKITTFHY